MNIYQLQLWASQWDFYNSCAPEWGSLKEKKAAEFWKSFTDGIKVLGSRGHCQLYESYPATLRASPTCPQHRTQCQTLWLPSICPSPGHSWNGGMGSASTLGSPRLSQASGSPWPPWCPETEDSPQDPGSQHLS